MYQHPEGTSTDKNGDILFMLISENISNMDPNISLSGMMKGNVYLNGEFLGEWPRNFG